ncbi:hypothetical protein ACHAPT_002560 [Fusarium lateritium]
MLSALIFLLALFLGFATQVTSSPSEITQCVTVPTCTVETVPKGPILQDLDVELEE